MAPGRCKSLNIKGLQKFTIYKKPLPLTGRGIFEAIFYNIWVILRFFAIDIILTINNYDAFVVCSRMVYFLRESHDKQAHNQ